MAERSRASSRSRRSYPNLHNLSLAPLSAKYPLDASAPPSPDEPSQTPRTSYIAQKSAPTTPGILSLSQSRSNSRTRSRHRTKPAYAYDGYFVSTDNPVRDAGDIPKAKSTSTLYHGVSFADELAGTEKRHHTRKATAPLPLRMPLTRHHTHDANDEWWYRAGLAIAGETRDSKGQGWLVRRESSTSLVQDAEHPDHHEPKRMALLSGEDPNPDTDFPTFSPRMSRAGSRYASRAPSARQSRRGSRVGSRADLHMTPGTNPASARHSLDLPTFDSRFMEPDFVDEHSDESSGDEEEVARLARDRGFGMGGWMDRLIGWTLFSVDEDGEASDEDDDESRDEGGFLPENMTRDELKLRREVEARRRKLEREAIVAAAKVKAREERGDEGEGEGSRPGTGVAEGEEGGGWKDAAWLLSVASKALF